MTQKNLKEQLAEMQNNLIALDKIINTPSEKTVKKFLITYVDGTEQWFVPEVMPEAFLETPPKYTTDEILAQLRKRATDLAKIKTADDPLVPKPLKRKGSTCVINGVRYNSIMHASRVLKLCRHRVKTNLDRGVTGWEYE